MTGPRQRLGRIGEDYVAGQLLARGWSLLTRNWRTRAGEIDLVALDGDMLVLVEVKARRRASFRPEEALTGRKQLQLLRMAEEYVAETGWPGAWRADVAAVEVDAQDRVTRFEIYEDAIGGD